MNYNFTRKILFAVFAYAFTFNVTFAQESNGLDLETLIITHGLPEFYIVGERPLIRAELDRIIHNTAEDPDAETATVLEMLRKMPLVIVDGDNRITVRGSDNFVVHMNGRPSGLFANNPGEVLNSMPANAVQSIEVITEPGARYAAEGVAGIINIVTMDNASMDGFTTTIRGGLSTLGGDAGLFVMAKQGRVGFMGNLSGFRIGVRDGSNEQTLWNTLDNSFVRQGGRLDIANQGFWGSGKLSFEINEQNLINVGYNTRFGMEDLTWYSEFFRSIDNFTYNSDVDMHYTWGGTDVNVDWQRTSAQNPRRMLTLSYRYSRSPNSSEFETNNFNPSENLPSDIIWGRTKQYTRAHTDEHSFQLDFTTPFAEIHSLEAGVKYTFRNNRSNNNHLQMTDTGDWQPLFPPNDERNDTRRFQHRNNIAAAYGSYSLNLNNWALRLGLRYEFTSVNVLFANNSELNFGTEYSNFVPSLTASYRINDSQNIRFGYNMRINRPGIWHLNPFVDNSNPNFISMGNPELDAVRTHTLSFNYALFLNRFNINFDLAHDFRNNGIEQVTEIYNNVSTTTFQNIGEKNDTRLMIHFDWRPIEGLRFFSNLGGSYVDIRANDGSGLQRNFFSGWMHAGAEYRLPWDLRFDAMVGGGSPVRTLQTTADRSFWHQLNLRRDFLNDRLSVRLYANNPFLNNSHVRRTIENPSLRQEQHIVFRPREFGFILSYRIGDLRAQIRSTERSIEIDDVIEGGQGGGMR